MPAVSADTVALRVDAPPAEVRAEPFRGDGSEAVPREADDLRVRRPWVQLPLEPLELLLHLFAQLLIVVHQAFGILAEHGQPHREVKPI